MKKAHTHKIQKEEEEDFCIQIFFSEFAERIASKGKFSKEIDPSIVNEYIYENFLPQIELTVSTEETYFIDRINIPRQFFIMMVTEIFAKE